MAKIALCLPALPSHAAVHGVLARELIARGHRCHMIGSEGLRPLAKREGLAFASLGPHEIPLQGAGLLRTLWATASATRAFIRHGPKVLAHLAPDLVIADQAEPGASLAAEAAGIARVTLASALPMDRDAQIPPPFVDWPWQEGEAGRKRNQGGWRVSDLLMVLQAKALAKGCQDYGLPMRRRLDEWISPQLDLRQMIPALDFPYPAPPSAEVVGPLRDLKPQDIDLETGGRPLVFASLGTLQKGRHRLLAAITQAARHLDICLALAHCGALTEAQARALSGPAIVRDFFPQQAVLARASACVTHAGLNTVLDCASAQVPMLAIPLAFEQPATAARLAYHGAACVVPAAQASPERIAKALDRLLRDPSYKAALRAPAAQIAAAGGVLRAANLIEAQLKGRVS